MGHRMHWLYSWPIICFFGLATLRTTLAQLTLASYNFDQGLAPMQLKIRDVDCPSSCPTVSSTTQDTRAGRTGRGLRVDVKGLVKVTNEWDVQLASPNFNLDPALLYTFCFWIRGGPGRLSAAVLLMKSQTFDTIAFKKINGITATWQQICLMDLKVNSTTTAFFAVNMAYQVGTYLIDDISFASHAMPDNGWLDNAQTRIKETRRGLVGLRFTDQNGRPLITGRIQALSITQASHDFPFGTAYAPEALWWGGRDLEFYTKMTPELFNALVPENLFKWPEYEKVPNYVTDQRNQMMRDHLAYAKDNKMVMVRGHAVEWYFAKYNYHWSRQGGCTMYRRYLQRRVQRDMATYAGKFQQYDVLNEPIHERGYFDRCNFSTSLIANLYKLAAVTDPTAKLCINEYNLLEGYAIDQFISLINDLRAQGAPIHCIGIQAHFQVDLIDLRVFRARLDRLAALGLPLYITELSLRTGWLYPESYSDPVLDLNPVDQAAILADVVTFFYSYPEIKGIWLWGWWDKVHWVKSGGIFYDDYTPKPAAKVLRHMWSSTWNSSYSWRMPELNPIGGMTFRAFYGNYNMAVTVGNRTFRGKVSIPTSKGAAQAYSFRLPITVPV